MTSRILVMGLPGAGKTYFAQLLKVEIEKLQPKSVDWYNADAVRKQYDDWDFSEEGRYRQAKRMRDLTWASVKNNKYGIADFVCPTPDLRMVFAADYTIWIDTIDFGRFEDTNRLFVDPAGFDFRLTYKMTWENAKKWAEIVADYIVNNKRRPKWDNRKETVQMLGRWQPWHAGHQALFDRALAKTGQVAIMIRDCQGWNDSNPFSPTEVQKRIHRALDMEYHGQFKVFVVPNIVNITYGRDVGYQIEQETFSDEIHNISATKIRAEMGLK